jgi:hypothetical protein
MPGPVAGSAGTVIIANAPTAISTSRVTTAPPALQSDVVLAQPSPSHVWVPGYWNLNGNKYDWVAGHWELPPYTAAVWVAPSWEQTGTVCRYTQGYWK